MARRMSKTTKLQPAELKIAINVKNTGTNYLDISQVASIVNRRFYRQGLNWAVSHFTFYKTTPTETGAEVVSVAKLPTSWVMSNAWEKGFRAWQKMISESLDDTDQQSLKGKFLDFKIYADETHFSNGFTSNLLPTDIEDNGVTPGEWIPSKISVPITAPAGSALFGSTRENEIMALGVNYGASGTEQLVSLINGYANSRGLPMPSDPNTPADADDASGGSAENWLAAMFNDGTNQTSDVIEEVTAYDQPPYPFEGDGINIDTMYPGGQTQLPAMRVVGASYFNAGTNANKVTIEGDSFPCGLVQIQNGTSASLSMIVHLVPGMHRGYLAEPMTDM